MQSIQDSELVPLKVGFDIAWRGFNRAQVTQHLDDLADELRLISADRDAALSQVDALTESMEQLRSEADSLRAEVHRLSRPPVSGGELSERLQRMLELANSEAAAITAHAQTSAEATISAARATADGLKQRYERLLVDLREQQRVLHAEHRSLMAAGRAEVDRMHKQAALRCQALDTHAANRRGAVEEDFRISMDDRRRTLAKEIEERQENSKATAEKLVLQARSKAKQLVDEASETAKHRVAEANSTAEQRISAAQQQVDTLQALRDQLNGQLTSALDLMRDAAPLLGTEAAEDAAEHDTPSSESEAETVRTLPVHPGQGAPGEPGAAQRDRSGRPIPEQQRHSAVPPSRGRGGSKPRPSPVNAGASRGTEQRG